MNRRKVAQYPITLEAEYRRYLYARTKLLYDSTLATIQQGLADAEERRTDALSYYLLFSAIESLKTLFFSTFAPSASILKRRGTAMAQATIRNADRVVKAIAQKGKSPLQPLPFVPDQPLVAQWVRENVSLIRSIDARWFDDIEKLIATSAEKDNPVEEIMAGLQDRYGVSRSRAKLIAEDQMYKLHSKATEARYRSYGIRGYEWQSQKDNKVRKRHAELDGKFIPYDEPPDIGHAGTPINCRCGQAPVIDQ